MPNDRKRTPEREARNRRWNFGTKPDGEIGMNAMPDEPQTESCPHCQELVVPRVMRYSLGAIREWTHFDYFCPKCLEFIREGDQDDDR